MIQLIFNIYFYYIVIYLIYNSNCFSKYIYLKYIIKLKIVISFQTHLQYDKWSILFS